MEIIVYCNVDTSTHTNHISKKEEIASRYVNEELLGRCLSDYRVKYTGRYLFEVTVFGFTVNTTLPRSSSIFF